MSNKSIKFSDLLGKTLIRIEGAESCSEKIMFTDSEGIRYVMYHHQDCCESVLVDDITGDISDLLNSPLTMAEETTSGEVIDGRPDHTSDSFTWTFYKLATVKGYVTIRWFGESNGYYSESVEFEIA